jgi:enoyl-CoA hydratase
MSDHLRLERDGDIAWLVLDRPEKRNAINLAMWEAIPGLLEEVEEDPAIKVLVLRGGDGRTFSAGADISEFETLRSTEEGARSYNASTEAAEHALQGLSKPTIAMVQGPCIGGGCGIATNCDLRFSDETARFGITPAKLGLVYSLPATKALVDLVGPSQAKYILFSGRQIPAARAREIGLVDEVYPSDELEQVVTDLARSIASRAQFSVRSTKRITRLIMDGAAEDTDESKHLRLTSFSSEDYREGVRAFLEKRDPHFTYS